MAPHLRSAGSNNLYAGYEEPKQAPRGRYAPRNSPRPAGEDKAKSARKSGKKGKGKTNAPRAAYVDHGTSMTPSPGKRGRSTPRKTPPPGGISKTPPGSKQRTPPPSPADPSLYKRHGRRVRDGLQINPVRSLEGQHVNRFPRIQLPESKGLKNFGNTCYQNAGLQALFHTPAFFRYLGKMHKRCRKRTQDCLVCALQYLAQTYWNEGYAMQAHPGNRVPGPLEPLRTFQHAISANPAGEREFTDLLNDLNEGEQGDAWEFLRYLLLHVSNEELPSDDAGYEATMRHSSDATWVCDTCGGTSTRVSQPGFLEQIIDVEIDAPARGLTMIEYLRRHFNDQHPEIRCEGACAEPRGRKKYPVRVQKWRISRFPEVLLIRMQRFHWTRGYDAHGNMVTVKISNDVKFDEYLNLAQIATDGQDTLYRLDGVVAHAGAGARSGHYIASVRKSNGTDFVVANDDISVGPTQQGRGTFLEMQDPSSNRSKFQPYVLMYSKV